MFKHFKNKKQLRHYLISCNIILGFVLFILMFYWLVFDRPQKILAATAQNQYGYYSIMNLPFNTGEVKQDYFGKPKEMQIASESKSESESDESYDTLTLNKKEEQLIKESDELLAKLDNLLADTHNSSGELEQILLPNEITDKQKKDSALTLNSQPKIAIIITNLGLNRKATELALTTPKEVALGFIPYTKTLKPLLAQALNNGHEVYLYLPMQTSSTSDNPGKYALKNNLPPEENATRLNMLLYSQPKYNGVYSSYKEIFTDNIQNSSIVFDQLDDQKLTFIMGKGKTKKVAQHFQDHRNIVPVNVVLDQETDKEFIKTKLESLAKLAEKNGIALGYSQGFVLTIEEIKDWIPSLEKRGISLVHVSGLLKGYEK